MLLTRRKRRIAKRVKRGNDEWLTRDYGSIMNDGWIEDVFSRSLVILFSRLLTVEVVLLQCRRWSRRIVPSRRCSKKWQSGVPGRWNRSGGWWVSIRTKTWTCWQRLHKGQTKQLREIPSIAYTGNQSLIFKIKSFFLAGNFYRTQQLKYGVIIYAMIFFHY